MNNKHPFYISSCRFEYSTLVLIGETWGRFFLMKNTPNIPMTNTINNNATTHKMIKMYHMLLSSTISTLEELPLTIMEAMGRVSFVAISVNEVNQKNVEHVTESTDTVVWI